MADPCDWQGQPLAVRITGLTVGDPIAHANPPADAPPVSEIALIVGPGHYETWFSFDTWEERPRVTSEGIVIALRTNGHIGVLS